MSNVNIHSHVADAYHMIKRNDYLLSGKDEEQECWGLRVVQFTLK